MKVACRLARFIHHGLAGSKIPVLREDALQVADRWSTNPHVGVAPVAVDRAAAKVLVADVESADEADVAVHDQQLAMVSHVDLKTAAEQIDRQEEAHLAPGSAQL